MSQKPNPYNHEIGKKGAWGASVILGDHEAEGKVRIGLAQFRTQILPFLADPNHKDVSYWLDYVKHPAVPLYVVDEQNQEVYVVPPLSASINTGVARIGTPALNGQMEMMRKRIERSPRSGEKEFVRTLSPHIRHAENIYSNRIRLNQILVAEGYPPLPLPGVPGGVTGVVATSTAVEQKPSAGYLDEFEDSDL